jgi:hypothetical protein
LDNVVKTDELFHYGLRPDFDPIPVIRSGLLPLSVVNPASAEERRDLYHQLDEQWAQPVLGPGVRHTGIFLTPVDFDQIPPDRPSIAWIQQFGRFRIPVTAVATDRAVLTWAGPFPRTSLALTTAALERAAALWPTALVARWFGRNSSKMFYDVPQVVTYQHRIPVSADQWDPPRLPR